MSDAATRGFVRGTERDRGCARVAMFLLQIGASEAARVLPHLDEAEVIGIAREIVRTSHVEQREAARVMEEFGYPKSAAGAETRGGAAAARRLLRAAFTDRRAAELLVAAELPVATMEHDANGTATPPAAARERQRGAPDDDR